MEREILMDVWLERKRGKKCGGPVCFLFETNKMFSLQNGEKTEGESLICMINKNTHVHLGFI